MLQKVYAFPLSLMATSFFCGIYQDGKIISRIIVLMEHHDIQTHQTVAKGIAEPAEDEDGSENEMLEEAL